MAENQYDGAPSEDLVHAWDQLHGLHNAVLHELLLVTAAMERRGVHTQDQQRSMRAWLQLHGGVTARTAGRWAGAAEKVDELPHLATALSEGRISFDKFVVCASFATPETDESVATEAVDGTIARCENEARATRRVSTREEDVVRRERYLSMSWVEEGRRLLLQGSLPAEEGATVQAALERIADSYPLFSEDGKLPGAAALKADALVELARTRVADDPDPDRATVVIDMPLSTLTNDGVGAPVNGGLMSSDVMQRLVCDARLQAVVRDQAGTVLGVGRATRTVPPHLRRVLDKRDRGCRFPGCTNTRFVDAHHIVRWSDGGSTDLTNLVLLCRAHHRLVHRQRLMIEGDPGDSIRFVDDEGRPVRAGPYGLEEDTRSWLRKQLALDAIGGARAAPAMAST